MGRIASWKRLTADKCSQSVAGIKNKEREELVPHDGGFG